MLIGARVVQGLGAALMNPSTLSIITVTFPPRQRGTAIGIWAGVSALALAIGPLVGGLITERVNWNWIFFINVPDRHPRASLAAFAFIDESRDTSARAAPRPRSGSLTSALGAVRAHLRADRGQHRRLGLDRGSSAPSRSRPSRSAASSRSRRASGCRCSSSRCSATAPSAARTRVMLLVALAMFGVFFYVSLYMQQVLGFSPIQAGASFLPMTRPDHPDRTVRRTLLRSDRLARRSPAPGCSCSSVSLFLFSRQGVHSDFFGLLPGMLTGGTGMALTMTPDDRGGDGLGARATRRASARRCSTACARSAARSGSPLMGAIVASGLSSGLAPGDRTPVAFTHGLHDGLEVAVADRARRLRASPSRRCASRATPRPRPPRRSSRHEQRARSARRRSGRRPSRLPAQERRKAVLDSACRVFFKTSYRGATTAEIAREAGITEPILYRHFGSKRDLYLACLDEAWRIFRECRRAGACADNPAGCLGAIMDAYMAKRAKLRLVDLWIQALTEASEDALIAKAVRQQIREVHAFLADVIRRGQADGVLHPRPRPGGRGLDLRRRRTARDDRPAPRRPARRRPRAGARLAPGLDGRAYGASPGAERLPTRRMNLRQGEAPAAAPGSLPVRRCALVNSTPNVGSAAQPSRLRGRRPSAPLRRPRVDSRRSHATLGPVQRRVSSRPVK